MTVSLSFLIIAYLLYIEANFCFPPSYDGIIVSSLEAKGAFSWYAT